MARTDSDTGAASLSGLLTFSAVIFLGCLLFLVVDVRHRITGYQAIYGKGIYGSVTVTECGSHLVNTYCEGDFVSTDGRVSRQRIRVNGATDLFSRAGHDGRLDHPVSYPAAVSAADADEAWTLNSKPWLRPSTAPLIALVPVALPLVVLWGLLRGGPGMRRRRMYQARTMRNRSLQRRNVAQRRQVRRGRVH